MVHTGAFKQRQILVGLVLITRRVAAAIVAVLSLLACMAAFEIEVDDPYRALIVVVGLLTLIMFAGTSNVDRTIIGRFWGSAASVIGSWFLLIGILLLIGYATKSSAQYSRTLVFAWAIITPPLIILAQQLIDAIEQTIARSPANSRRVVIAGVNDLSKTLAEKIRSKPQFGMSLCGLFDDRSLERLGPDQCGGELLGKLKDLPAYVREFRIDQIFITLPMRNIDRVTELLDELQNSTASIYFVPDVFVFDLIQCRTGDIDGLPVVALCETPFYGTRSIVKRTSDLVIASLILILASPVLLAIAIAIKATSPGTVIFRQRRYGLDGREIVVYKFRSMIVSEDSDDIRQATREDTRLTSIGAFLRKYSLDEFPQFFNVLQGRMSVVGPRPHAVAHNEEYRKLIRGYMIRHKVTPGITGLAQINGYRGETANVEDMRRRVEYDLNYLRSWSLALDLKIVFKTATQFMFDKAAY